MRKLLFVIACMMAVMQQTAAQEQFPSASDYARLYVGAVEPQYESWLWHDVAYYKGDTRMYDGRISYHGVPPLFSTNLSYPPTITCNPNPESIVLQCSVCSSEGAAML